MENTQFTGNVPVFTLQIAGALMTQGFRLADIADNWKFPHLKVYYFKDSPEFRDALKKLTQRY